MANQNKPTHSIFEVLSCHGRNFQKQCYRMLKEEHDYETFIYNSKQNNCLVFFQPLFDYYNKYDCIIFIFDIIFNRPMSINQIPNTLNYSFIKKYFDDETIEDMLTLCKFKCQCLPYSEKYSRIIKEINDDRPKTDIF